MKTPFTRWLTLVLAVLASACSPYSVHELSRPAVDVPEAYVAVPEAADAAAPPARWWQAFREPLLEELEEQVLEANLDLRQAWRRLDQVAAEARIAGAPLVPQIDADGGASFTRRVDREADPPLPKDDTSESYFVGAGLSYELDVWRRIASGWKAAGLRFEASREDVEATALLLSGTVAELWFVILEQESLSRVVAAQVAAGLQFLELTELRFSLGQGSALDVFQQRQQVAATRSALPVILTTLETSRNQLAVLLGQLPGTLEQNSSGLGLPELPPLPALPSPGALFDSRPDLRAAMLRLQAADYEVASAVAERFPRFGVSLSYDFSATRTGSLFKQEIGTILGNFVLPIVDGGRRRAQVERRKAIVQEQLERFTQVYLEALLEIENAVVTERRQVELLERLGEEFALANSTLEESRSRYANGLNDYLSVLVALQSVQSLERRLVSENRFLLATRANLYRALGGKDWTRELEAPAPRELSERAEPGQAEGEA